MSALILKLVACATMLCDHIGYLGGPAILRSIGRVAFPIFAYLIAIGYKKTSDPYKYLLRLITAGLISESIYDYCFFGGAHANSLNVMFTLALGLLAVMFVDKLSTSYRFPMSLLYVLPVATLCIASDMLHTDYGAWGVILIVLFYLSDGNKPINIALTIASSFAFAGRYYIRASLYNLIYTISAALPALTFLPSGTPILVSSWQATQIFSAFALACILLYNGKPGIVIKNHVLLKLYQYSFYAFYPAHLLVLALIFR